MGGLKMSDTEEYCKLHNGVGVIVKSRTLLKSVENQKPISKISKDRTLVAEGIVARAYPMFLFRDGTPVMWKLKVRDFKE